MMDLLPGGDEVTRRPSTSPARSRPKADESTASRSDTRDRARAADPALAMRFNRYIGDLKIPEAQADLLTGDKAVAALYEAALEAHDNPKGIANWITTEVLREVKGGSIDQLPFRGEKIGELVALIDSGRISGKIAKDVFATMLETGHGPREIVRERGLEQVTDPGALEPIVDALLDANRDKVEAYRAGKTGLLGFFVGQVMRETGGTANPELVQQLVRDKLS